MTKKALGKGLGALIKAGISSKVDSPSSSTEEQLAKTLVPLKDIVPSTFQPRKTFNPQELQELVDSIKSLGVIQPLIVRKHGEKYELIAGERRWRAAQEAGLTEVPVVEREISDQQVLTWALVENLQRADLNPLEEAEGYAKLSADFSMTQEQIAQQVGKSRAHIANLMRLVQLPQDLQGYVRQGILSLGHAKVLLSLPSAKEQELVADQIIKRNLSVREAERLVLRQHRKRQRNGTTKSKSLDHADWRDLEHQLQRKLGSKTRIVGTQSKGKIEIDYYNSDDLQRILETLGVVE